jgi:hypothetical protein
MGIEYEDMRLILQATRHLQRRERLLVLGDAIVHFGSADLERLAGETGTTLAWRPPDAKLDPFLLGRALGFQSTETLDINGKATITLDLQAPLPPTLRAAYDCVIEAGVLFWCFEPGAALMNVYRLLRGSGVAIHITAASGHYGRGYYNIHPLLFEDFYLSNDARFLFSTLRTKYSVPTPVGRLLSALRVRNTVTRSDVPGNVYLAESRFNRMRFSSSRASPRESNLIPNNVVAVLAFEKRRDGEPVQPHRSSPYEPPG